MMSPAICACSPSSPTSSASNINPLSPRRLTGLYTIETAFRLFYDGFGGGVSQAMESKEPQERQTGQVLARLEYENLSTALDYALAADVSMVSIYWALSLYLDATQDQRRGLELGQSVLARLEQYPPEALAGQLSAEFLGVLATARKGSS